ncbi:MAG: HD domain-containing phosphohydrolase [Pseudothermotoga sp.]
MKTIIGFIIIFYSAVLLLELTLNFNPLAAAVILVLPVIHGAVSWKSIGGAVFSLISSNVLLLGYFGRISLAEYLISLTGYSVVGILIGIVLRFADRQKRLLKESEDRYRNLSKQFQMYLDLVDVMIVSLDLQGKINFVNKKGCEILGYAREEILGKNWFENFIPQGILYEVKNYLSELLARDSADEYHENSVVTRDGKERIILWHNSVLRDDTGEVTGILSSGLDITELKQTKSQLEEQLQNAKILYKAAEELIIEELDAIKRAEKLSKICVENFGASMAWVGQALPDRSVKIIGQFPKDHPYLEDLIVRWDDSLFANGAAGRSIKTGKNQIIEDVATDERFSAWKEKAQRFGIRTVAAFPLISPRGVFGTLVLYSDKPGFFNSQKMDQIQMIAHIAAASLENARLFDQLEKRFLRMEALHKIDKAISASTDLSVTLSVLMDQVIHQLNVNACDIFLLNSNTLILELVASRGFRVPLTEISSIKIGESLAGQVALQRRVLKEIVTQRGDEQGKALCQQRKIMMKEGFKSYMGVPLTAKGQLLGVLEVFSRSSIEEDEDWFEYLQILAQQGAIAIENSMLFESLQKSNVELARAYDATIEGWASMMDLRDRETEGHSQRVTLLTLKMAKQMKIDDRELIHIRRGALLHDMGKMAIPDQILLKPGKLTDEEWEIMKKHPIYAYQMLSKIDYLRPALDIPYCHHERFDGTGYPRGLKGEEIPLSARIFAVADVYDALTSDRPYRKAWSKEEAVEYIKSQSGKHFDPKVVEVFLKLLEQEEI